MFTGLSPWLSRPQRKKKHDKRLAGHLGDVLFAHRFWAERFGRLGRDARERAGARLWRQPDPQRPARERARHGRERAAGALGYRPRVNAHGRCRRRHRHRDAAANRVSARRTDDHTIPRGVGLQVDQTLFNGFRTFNSVRQAESQVLGARETLRNTEQNVLFDGATAYMNVLRDTAILNLQRNNVEVLEEQLRQTRDRFNVGEVTRTDVAQAESRLAPARSQVSLAESNLRASIARFRQVIGVEPRQLAPGRPARPAACRARVEAAPSHRAARAPGDPRGAACGRRRRAAGQGHRGRALPDRRRPRQRSQRWDIQVPGDERFTASVVGTPHRADLRGRRGLCPRPPGQGDRRAAAHRGRCDARPGARQVVSAWGQLEAAKAQIIAAQAQVQAAEVALTGVREEARVGQRTTLDVLNAQQELLTARVNLITAQRDRVVASYAVVQAMGRLSTRALRSTSNLQRQAALRSGEGPLVRRAHAGRALKLA